MTTFYDAKREIHRCLTLWFMHIIDRRARTQSPAQARTNPETGHAASLMTAG